MSSTDPIRDFINNGLQSFPIHILTVHPEHYSSVVSDNAFSKNPSHTAWLDLGNVT